jgi:hypothetical protein
LAPLTPWSVKTRAHPAAWSATGDPARVAEWAGHSVVVLLRVYAKCIHGMETEILRRIWDATRTPDDDGGDRR